MTFIIILALALSDATIRFEPARAGVDVWLDWTTTVDSYQVIITDPELIDAFLGGTYSDAFEVHPGGDFPHLHDFRDAMLCEPDLILTLDGATMLDLPDIGSVRLATMQFSVCLPIEASCAACFGGGCTFHSTAASQGVAVETTLVPGSTCESCDFDGDGCVGIGDLLWVLGHWNSDQFQMGIDQFLCVLGSWGC